MRLTQGPTHPSPNSQPGEPKTLLIDEHELSRRGLRLLLNADFGYEVIEAATRRDAITWCPDPKIRLAIIAAQPGGADPGWLLENLKAHRDDLPVLIVSTSGDDDEVDMAIEGGAQGYVLTAATTHQLHEAVETALSRRGVYIDPSVAMRVFARRRNEERMADLLSDREIAILKLLVAGSTNTSIADALYLSEKTVKSHITAVLRKLEVTNRTQAVARAIRDRLVSLDDLSLPLPLRPPSESRTLATATLG